MFDGPSETAFNRVRDQACCSNTSTGCRQGLAWSEKASKQAASLCVKWLVMMLQLCYTLCKQCFLCKQVRTPLYGCDCYAYGLLSAGFCDLVVEADMKPYDYMALVPIVEGAGGIMTDWKVRITASDSATVFQA